MTGDTMSIHKLAADTFKMFTTSVREDGTRYVTLNDGAPDWVGTMVRDAHGDRLPDDGTYALVHSALDYISDAGHETADDVRDAGTDSEFADAQTDVYSHDLADWYGASSYHRDYTVQAAEDGLVAADADIDARIMAGQYVQATEVFNIVLQALEDAPYSCPNCGEADVFACQCDDDDPAGPVGDLQSGPDASDIL